LPSFLASHHDTISHSYIDEFNIATTTSFASFDPRSFENHMSNLHNSHARGAPSGTPVFGSPNPPLDQTNNRTKKNRTPSFTLRNSAMSLDTILENANLRDLMLLLTCDHSRYVEYAYDVVLVAVLCGISITDVYIPPDPDKDLSSSEGSPFDISRDILSLFTLDKGIDTMKRKLQQFFSAAEQKLKKVKKLQTQLHLFKATNAAPSANVLVNRYHIDPTTTSKSLLDNRYGIDPKIKPELDKSDKTKTSPKSSSKLNTSEPKNPFANEIKRKNDSVTKLREMYDELSKELDALSVRRRRCVDYLLTASNFFVWLLSLWDFNDVPLQREHILLVEIMLARRSIIHLPAQPFPTPITYERETEEFDERTGTIVTKVINVHGIRPEVANMFEFYELQRWLFENNRMLQEFNIVTRACGKNFTRIHHSSTQQHVMLNVLQLLADHPDNQEVSGSAGFHY
jgi:hypothetical protein